MKATGQYVVCVEFQTVEGALDQFLPLVVQQAQNSCQLEPGCHVFDVASDGERAVFLYEIYTDRATFDLHLRSDHFLSFDEAIAGLIVSKEVKFFSLVEVLEAS
ncbi:putative quinol monooxygenase [Paracoccus sp. (in: a-proteobacteria)]|uniref:putative quinol monooxygenase n=1 Tax=Paracoccus sp. TaxID=267 RepID=UPI004059141C